jgi:transposase
MPDTFLQHSESTADDRAIELFVALELSKKTWVVATHMRSSNKISQHRIIGGDTERLLSLIERLRMRAAGTSKTMVKIICCYEAGRDGFWLHRMLTRHGISNYVVDPASVHVSRRARRAKTDRLDAEALVRVLMAYARGEHKICSMVCVPTVDEEDAKRPHRERERLIGARTAHVNRIKGLLATQGVKYNSPLRADWPEQLKGLCTGDGRPIPPRLAAELIREWQRLQLVIELIATVERDREDWQTEDKTSTGVEPKIERLRKLRGVGPIFATVLTREVFYRSFANRREVGSYVGLAPTPFNSGESRRDQGVSKAGNPRARATAIELAWLWLRHQPDSALSQWYRQRVGTLYGRIRKITIVAVARKLVVALWRYLETGVMPTGAVLKV